jgi:hypothetical protein
MGDRQKAAFLALLLSFASFAAAQHGPFYTPCIDTLAIDSKSILVGRIVDIGEAAPNPPGGAVIDVSVERWLKGDGAGRIRTPIYAPPIILTQWRNRGSRLLIFPERQPDKFLRGNAIELSGASRVLTADMTVLSDPALIVQAMQKAIERYRGVNRVFTFERSLPAVSDPGDLELVTAVPVNSDLERWAISALASKVDGERMEAAQALMYFPSDANAGRLKRLLDDPAVYASGNAQVYYVRQAAYESLKLMGVTVPAPVISEPRAQPE